MEYGQWKQVNELTWQHPSGLKLWIEKSERPAGYCVITQMDGYPATTESFDDCEFFGWLADAIDLAIQFMKENPEAV